MLARHLCLSTWHVSDRANPSWPAAPPRHTHRDGLEVVVQKVVERRHEAVVDESGEEVPALAQFDLCAARHDKRTACMDGENSGESRRWWAHAARGATETRFSAHAPKTLSSLSSSPVSTMQWPRASTSGMRSFDFRSSVLEMVCSKRRSEGAGVRKEVPKAEPHHTTQQIGRAFSYLGWARGTAYIFLSGAQFGCEERNGGCVCV